MKLQLPPIVVDDAPEGLAAGQRATVTVDVVLASVSETTMLEADGSTTVSTQGIALQDPEALPPRVAVK